MPKAHANALHALVSSDHQDPEAILAGIVGLRESLVAAWQERAVTFTRDERAQLRAEMEETASVLEALSRLA